MNRTSTTSEEDPRILATYYMSYKIGILSTLVHIFIFLSLSNVVLSFGNTLCVAPLNGCCQVFAPKILEVVGTYEWYYQCNLSSRDTAIYKCIYRHIQILPVVIKFVWTVGTFRQWVAKTSAIECSRLTLTT